MIISKSNDLIKYIRSLHTKKVRDENNEYIIEGIKLVKEAIEYNLEIKKIIICEEIIKEEINTKKYEVEYVNQNLFEYISDTKTPQGILAIIKKQENNSKHYDNIIFALDNVQDPGNLGTIIRTLDCAGINTLLLSEGCADEYNLKVIRSTMGAIFRVKIHSNINLLEELIRLQKEGYKVIVTALDGAKSLFEHKFDEKSIIVIGNESNGVSKEIQEVADVKIKIPMAGNTESLNAGVAASLMAYEVYRKSL